MRNFFIKFYFLVIEFRLNWFWFFFNFCKYSGLIIMNRCNSLLILFEFIFHIQFILNSLVIFYIIFQYLKLFLMHNIRIESSNTFYFSMFLISTSLTLIFRFWWRWTLILNYFIWRFRYFITNRFIILFIL